MTNVRDILIAVSADYDLTGQAECERQYAEVLAAIVGLEQVPLDSHFFDDLGADSMVMARFCARVRKRPDLPSVSMPDVYKHPTIRSLTAALAPSLPTAVPANHDLTGQAECERQYAEVLAAIVGLEQVPLDSHFFDDLGADSMVMARFCARVRKRPDLPSVSMPDVYKHPTIRSLTAALAPSLPTAVPANHDLTGQAECERQYAEVLAAIVGLEQVPLDSHFFDDLGADSMVMARFCARVRKRPDLPSVSMPDVYKHPTIRSLTAALAPSLPTAVPANHDLTGQAECERQYAEVLAAIVGLEQVPLDSHFFDDLGADSMVMARFCARVRKRPDLPSVSMPDVYKHPTIRSLTAALVPTSTTAKSKPPSQPADAAALIEPPRRASSVEYVLCGALQLLFLLGAPALTIAVGVKGYEWIASGEDAVDVYLRAVVFGNVGFLLLCTLPIVLKWVVIGRWKPQEIRVWSMAYFRFWLVKTLIQRNPLALFVGSPLYAFYLRALGAKVGRGAVIYSKAPVCTDLLSIGEGAVIRKDSVLNGYRVDDGIIRTGPVSVGKNAIIGEVTVLDIWTSVGDGAQVGHASSLQVGQAVPDGEHWHGSPARPTGVDQQRIPQMRLSVWRLVAFETVQLANLLLVGTPLAFVIAHLALENIPQLAALMDAGPAALTSSEFYGDALALSAVLFFGFALLGLVFVITVPRVLNLFLTPDKVYPLYGFHYWVQRTIARMTNRQFYMRLFGGTSYVVHYLRWVGYDLRNVRQTGSNFGEGVKHDTPFLNAVGSGTMVADGLSMINADFSSTSFRLSHVSIGAENFLGNRIVYSSQGKTGDNCLLATKLMVPLDGHVREGVGLLGAPSFEIPRSVRRDRELDVDSEEELRERLWAKNVHNTVSMAMFLLEQWIFSIILTVLYMAAIDVWASLGVLAFALATVGTIVFTVGYVVLVERLIMPLQTLRPQGCSIYDRAFWRHERFWKMSSGDRLEAFNGTPMKIVLWRLMGARIGRRVFDDGCALTERSFTTIGDDCTLNAGSVIQCHSQEDGGFKSDHTAIGAGCTLGVGAFVHYGVTMGDGAALATDSFLMKGEEMPPNAVWGGNPAIAMRQHPGDLPARRTSSDDNRAAVLVRSG